MASSDGVTLAKAWVTIVPTAEGAEKAITEAIVPAAEEAGGEAGKRSGGALSASMGKSLSSTGAKMTLGLTTPLLGAGKAAVDVGMSFESSMQNVAALSGATGGELAELEDTARHFGATTQFSASEAADALGYMALAGWDTKEMTDGLGGVLDLAAASGMDLASASDMVTDYLSAFGLEADRSADFADRLAYAQANSNTSAAMLGEAFKNCAANLNASGQDMETTTSLLAMMANQGLKGSEAGTALAAIMRDITAQMEDGSIAIGDTAVAVTDADGNFRDLTDILLDVESATYGMGDAERAAALSSTFTADSTKGLNLLLNAGVGEAAAFEQGLLGSEGAASAMAATMQDSLSGQMKTLNSKIEEVGIQLFETLAPALSTIVDGIGNAVSAFSEWWGSLDSGTQTAIVGAVGVVAALGPVLTAVGSIVSVLPTLSAGIGAAKTAFGLFSTVLRANPIGIVVTVLGTLVGAFVTAYNTNDEFRAKVDEAWNFIRTTAESIFGGIVETIGGAWSAITEAVGPVWEAITGTLGGIWDGIRSAGETAFGAVSDAINGDWSTVQEHAGNTWNDIKTSLGNTWESMKTNAGAAFEATKLVIGRVWERVKTDAGPAWEGIKSRLGTAWESIKTNASTKFEAVRSAVGTAWSNISTAAGTAWSGITGSLGTAWESIKSAASTKFEGVRSTIGTVWSNISNAAGGAWGNISSNVQSIWGNISSAASTKFGGISSTLTTIWSNISSNASGIWAGIQSAMTNPMSTAQTLISNIVGTISNIVGGIRLQLPSIALPHFWVSGGEAPWGIAGMGYPPSFGVDWYARGAIIDGARIVGVGEAGPEAIVPLSGRAMQPFADAIASAMGGAGQSQGARFVIEKMVVREEADIDRIARRLHQLEQRGASFA